MRRGDRRWRAGGAGGRAPAPSRAARPPRARRRALRIIGTNDFHGALEPRPDAAGVRRGGAAYLAPRSRARAPSASRRRARRCSLDGGDVFQGTPASNLAFGRPVVELFNQLGYAAAALGNHEFDWGQDTLRARMREARYRVPRRQRPLRRRPRRPWIRDDTLIVRGRLKVGVIGVATVLDAAHDARRRTSRAFASSAGADRGQPRAPRCARAARTT